MKKTSDTRSELRNRLCDIIEKVFLGDDGVCVACGILPEGYAQLILQMRMEREVRLARAL